MFDDLEPRPKRIFQIGQDLSEMSLDEIDETVADLEAEIQRLKVERSSKSASLDAAQAFFKK